MERVEASVTGQDYVMMNVVNNGSTVFYNETVKAVEVAKAVHKAVPAADLNVVAECCADCIGRDRAGAACVLNCTEKLGKLVKSFGNCHTKLVKPQHLGR